MSDIDVTHSFGVTPKVDPAASSMMRIAEQQAVAEIQGMVVVAHRFPRDPVSAVNLLLQDCQRLELAQVATYNFSRGGNEIEGPSIKLVKQAAIRWRNIKAGGGQLFVQDNKSYCRAWAYDLEANVMEERYFVVPHVRDTRNGSYTLVDERDIKHLVFAIVQQNKRSCVEALIDADVLEAAVKQCKKTLTIKAEVTPERLAEMTKKFDEFGVSKTMIERRIQRNIEAMQPATLIKLGQIYNALRDGAGVVTDYFIPDDTIDQPGGESRTEQAKAKAKGRAGRKTDAPPPDGASPPAAQAKPEAKPAAKTATSTTITTTTTTKTDAPTFAQVADAMKHAATREQLDAAGQQIAFVLDEGQRNELADLFDARAREFAEDSGDGS